MPRGQLWRTKIKNWYWQEKKKWQAYFNAKEEQYKKNPALYWREVAAAILKNIDPIETAAILGSTVVVHEVIFKLGEFTDVVNKIRPDSMIANAIWTLFNVSEEDKQKLNAEFFGEQVTGTLKNADIQGQVMVWLVSFAIAYFAIKHGAELLSVARTFFGIGTVAA